MPRLILPNWTRTGPQHSGRWTHITGCVVSHCGHPTALYPYTGCLPDGHAPTLDFRGKKGICVPKFTYLHECQEWILEQHDARAKVLVITTAIMADNPPARLQLND